MEPGETGDREERLRLSRDLNRDDHPVCRAVVRLMAQSEGHTEMLRKLHLAISGDEEMGHRGLVERMEAVECRVKSLKGKVAWYSAAAAGFGAGLMALKDFFGSGK